MSERDGIDLINWRPDYSKSKEDNDESYRQAYRKVYGEDPPALPSQEDFKERLKKAKGKSPLFPV